MSDETDDRKDHIAVYWHKAPSADIIDFKCANRDIVRSPQEGEILRLGTEPYQWRTIFKYSEKLEQYLIKNKFRLKHRGSVLHYRERLPNDLELIYQMFE